MKKTMYHIGRLTEEEELELNFSDSLMRTVYERIALGFIPMKLPVFDEEHYRIFDTMEDYRQWANGNIPSWLGYCRRDD